MDEYELAVREGASNGAEDAFFKARPAMDCPPHRRVFQAGFYRGWEAAPKVSRDAIAHLRAKCDKCGGAGWLWSHELEKADEATREDTMTKYSCDGEMCALAGELEERFNSN